jgi:GNAT superfamily N-acetyltransferase
MEAARPAIVSLYRTEDSDEALELEKQCVQGKTFRMTFRRSAFHRRAENYSEYQIFTARIDGRLVGIAAAAIKDSLLFGNATKASFYFDLRVHPSFRGRGIGRSLMREAYEWGIERSEIAYTYALAENRTATHIGKLLGGTVVGGFSYLVYPVSRAAAAVPWADCTSFAEVHDSMLATSAGFDFYTRPDLEARRGGYVGSWTITDRAGRAGCSVWNNRGILGEVIESLPLWLHVIGRVAGASSLLRERIPRIPVKGEELRSWYLFDFFSTDARLARGLMQFIAGQAYEAKIDYCYLPHTPQDVWIREIKKDVPAFIVPVIPYYMLARRRGEQVGPVSKLYVDIRDL